MEVNTSRFGDIKVTKEDILTFPEGLLGFNQLREFILLDDPDDEIFAWLQSCEVAEIAFPILEPELLLQGYHVQLSRFDHETLGLDEKSKAWKEAIRVFCIVTIPTDPTLMTANLKAPVVINILNRRARQVVLPDNNLSIREPIFMTFKSRVVQNPQASFKSQASDSGMAIRLPERRRDNEVDL